MNSFDQSGVGSNEFGLRPTLKKLAPKTSSATKFRSTFSVTGETKKGSLANLSQQPAEEKKVDFDEKVSFLNKLTSTVKRIEEYQDIVGKSAGRKMKLQGALSSDCKMDIQAHFSKPDFKRQKVLEEKEEERKRELKEASTIVGAVKRLITRVSSLSVTDNLITRGTDPPIMTTLQKKRLSRPLSPPSILTIDSEIKGTPRVRRALTLNRGFYPSFLSQQKSVQGNRGESAVGEQNSSINSNPGYTQSQFARSQSRDAMQSMERPSLGSAAKNGIDTLMRDIDQAYAKRGIVSTDNLDGQEASELASNTPLGALVDRVKNRHKISLKDIVKEDYREEAQSPIKRLNSDGKTTNEQSKKFTLQEQRGSFLSGELLVQSESGIQNNTSISREEVYNNFNTSHTPTPIKTFATAPSHSKFFKTAVATITPIAKTSTARMNRQESRKKTITAGNERSSNSRGNFGLAINTQQQGTGDRDIKQAKTTQQTRAPEQSNNRRKEGPLLSMSQLHKQITTNYKSNSRGKATLQAPTTVRQPIGKRQQRQQQKSRHAVSRTTKVNLEEEGSPGIKNMGGTTGETKNYLQADLPQSYQESKKGQWTPKSHLFNPTTETSEVSNANPAGSRSPHPSLQQRKTKIRQISSPVAASQTQADIYSKWGPTGTRQKKHRVKLFNGAATAHGGGGTASLGRRNKLMKGAYIFDKAIILAPTIINKSNTTGNSTMNLSRSQRAVARQRQISQQNQNHQNLRITTNTSRATPNGCEKLDRLANTYFDGRDPKAIEEALRSNQKSPNGTNVGSAQDCLREQDRSRSSQRRNSPNLKSPAQLKHRRRKMVRRKFHRNAVSVTKDDQGVGEIGGNDGENQEREEQPKYQDQDDELRLVVPPIDGTKSPNLTQRRRPEKLLNLGEIDQQHPNKLFGARTPAQTSRPNRRMKDPNYLTSVQPNEMTTTQQQFAATQNSSRKTSQQSRLHHPGAFNQNGGGGGSSYGADQSIKTAQLVYLGSLQPMTTKATGGGEVKLPKIGEKGPSSIPAKDRYQVYLSPINQPQHVMMKTTTISKPGSKIVKAAIMQKKYQGS